MSTQCHGNGDGYLGTPVGFAAEIVPRFGVRPALWERRGKGRTPWDEGEVQHKEGIQKPVERAISVGVARFQADRGGGAGNEREVQDEKRIKETIKKRIRIRVPPDEVRTAAHLTTDLGEGKITHTCTL